MAAILSRHNQAFYRPWIDRDRGTYSRITQVIFDRYRQGIELDATFGQEDAIGSAFSRSFAIGTIGATRSIRAPARLRTVVPPRGKSERCDAVLIDMRRKIGILEQRIERCLKGQLCARAAEWNGAVMNRRSCCLDGLPQAPWRRAATSAEDSHDRPSMFPPEPWDSRTRG